jgi:hypothetical protein
MQAGLYAPHPACRPQASSASFNLNFLQIREPPAARAFIIAVPFTGEIKCGHLQPKMLSPKPACLRSKVFFRRARRYIYYEACKTRKFCFP